MTNNQILHYVGHDGEQSVNSAMTQRLQLVNLPLRCDLVTDEGEALTWLDFDNPDEPQTLFQFILGDHKHRVDQRNTMANQPPLGVATVVDDACIRFEFYEGYHTLKKTYDLRSKDLQDVELEDFIETTERIMSGAV